MKFATEPHERVFPPDDRETPIWRYIDFTKLVSLLSTRKLFFSRADRLGDPFEGSVSAASLERRTTRWAESKPQMFATLSGINEALPRFTYVNCWNLSQHESTALWNLYVPPSGGVAIRSTYNRLASCFEAEAEDAATTSMNRTVFAGQVQYVDYRSDLIPTGNTLGQFFYKRLSFEFESELRALIQDVPSVPNPSPEGSTETIADLTLPSASGKAVPVDLGVLVERIYVSPLAPEWFLDLVRSVCETYELRASVQQSVLSERPVY